MLKILTILSVINIWNNAHSLLLLKNYLVKACGNFHNSNPTVSKLH